MKVKTLFLLIAGFVLLTSFQIKTRHYNFQISLGQVREGLAKTISVNIINHGQTVVRLNNLVFSFNHDNGSIWGYNENGRFLTKTLELKPGQQYKAIYSVDSLAFTNYDGKPLSLQEVKDKMRQSRKRSISASMTDLNLHQNPLLSSYSTFSNIVKL